MCCLILRTKTEVRSVWKANESSQYKPGKMVLIWNERLPLPSFQKEKKKQTNKHGELEIRINVLLYLTLLY
jgi:hypothetical protein